MFFIKLTDVLEDYGKAMLRFDKINHLEANVVLIVSLKVSSKIKKCHV